MPSVTIELSDEALRRFGVMAGRRGIPLEAWVAEVAEREAKELGPVYEEPGDPGALQAALEECKRRWLDRTPEQVLADRAEILKTARLGRPLPMPPGEPPFPAAPASPQNGVGGARVERETAS